MCRNCHKIIPIEQTDKKILVPCRCAFQRIAAGDARCEWCCGRIHRLKKGATARIWSTPPLQKLAKSFQGTMNVVSKYPRRDQRQIMGQRNFTPHPRDITKILQGGHTPRVELLMMHWLRNSVMGQSTYISRTITKCIQR